MDTGVAGCLHRWHRVSPSHVRLSGYPLTPIASGNGSRYHGSWGG
jgi:hypothetical protein